MKLMKFFLMMALFAAACQDDRSNNAVPPPVAEYPDQESWDATVVITKDGKTRGLIKAGHVEKYTKKQTTYLSDSIQVDFYNQEGLHTSVLTSLGGKIFGKKQDMIAYGNVIVVSDSGVTLYTDTLIWDNKRQKIISRIPVKITTDEGDIFYGDSFISDPNLVDYELENPHGTSSKTLSIEK